MIAIVEVDTNNYRNRTGAIITRKVLIDARNSRIQSRFNELYNQERLRYDDVLTRLCEEFFLAKRTIENVMRG